MMPMKCDSITQSIAHVQNITVIHMRVRNYNVVNSTLYTVPTNESIIRAISAEWKIQKLDTLNRNIRFLNIQINNVFYNLEANTIQRLYRSTNMIEIS